jgi:UDP-GlcNAc:undecaprenyl-phosphate/decaprenyl-phosphate GlcNAc-1-phosphate transferase
VPRRANYRGRQVVHPLGVVLLAAALVALAFEPSRWLVFLAGVGALGLLDDLAGGSARGWRGHGGALARGQVSTGAIKAAGTLGLAAYAAAPDAEGAPYVAAVGVLTLAAHVGNLLDTRPGRSEKALGVVAAGVCVGTWSLAPLEPIAALIAPVVLCAWLTLRERAMLGDTGASMIGGMAGVLLVATLSPAGLYFALALLLVLSVYGEIRPISAAIERLVPLKHLDAVGRLRRE